MTDLASPRLNDLSPSKNSQEMEMATIEVSQCRRASTISEADIKASVDEYISPDILHIFREDKPEAPAKINNSAPSDKILSQFPQFQRLPLEIRYLIWEAAVPEPTVVPRTWNNNKFRYNLQGGVPAVLQACAESRGLLVAQPGASRRAGASPKYELVQTRGHKDEGVYMDFEKDSIWVYRGCEFVAVPDLCSAHASHVESGSLTFPRQTTSTTPRSRHTRASAAL